MWDMACFYQASNYLRYKHNPHSAKVQSNLDQDEKSSVSLSLEAYCEKH